MRRLACLVLGLVICSGARHAAAQVNNIAGPPDPSATLLFVHPNQSDGEGTIYCGFPQPGCIPFNVAACSNQNLVEMSFSSNGNSTLSGISAGTNYAYAWVQNYAGTCSTPAITVTSTASDSNTVASDGNTTSSTPITVGSQIWNFSNNTLGTAAQSAAPIGTNSSFLGGTQALDWPTSFGTPQVTFSSIMNAFPGVCDAGGGIPLTRFKLCMCIDTTGDHCINNNTSGTTSSSTDLTDGFEIPVDTVPPITPTLDTVGKVATIDVTAYYDITLADTFAVNLLYSSDSNDLANVDDSNATCGSWQHATVLQNIVTDQSGVTSWSIDVPNFVPFGFCTQAVDYVGNLSDFSAVTQDQAHPECDLFECWPPDVPIALGYCGAHSNPPVWLAALLLGYWLQRRRRASRCRRLGLPAGLLALGWLNAAPAAAQTPLATLGVYPPLYGVNVKLGFYRPVISESRQVNFVRNKIDPDYAYFKHPLLYQLQGDYYFWRQAGLLGAYLRAGLWSDSAASRLCKNAAGTIILCTAAIIGDSITGTDTANMTVVPLSLGLTYQFDTLRRLYDIPLNAGVQLGFDYDLWWASVGRSRSVLFGDTSRAARGGNAGLSFSASLAFALDYFSRNYQPYGSRPTAQNSYLFVEYTYMNGKALFSNKPFIDLSDWGVASLGLAFNFR